MKLTKQDRIYIALGATSLAAEYPEHLTNEEKLTAITLATWAATETDKRLRTSDAIRRLLAIATAVKNGEDLIFEGEE